jgi:hypothetical protein
MFNYPVTLTPDGDSLLVTFVDVPEAITFGMDERMKEVHESAAYDKWFRAQVQEALDDPRPAVSHEEVKKEFAALRADIDRDRLAR